MIEDFLFFISDFLFLSCLTRRLYNLIPHARYNLIALLSVKPWESLCVHYYRGLTWCTTTDVLSSIRLPLLGGGSPYITNLKYQKYLDLDPFLLEHSFNNMPTLLAQERQEEESSLPSNFSWQWLKPWELKPGRVSWDFTISTLLAQKSFWSNFTGPFGKMTLNL